MFILSTEVKTDLWIDPRWSDMSTVRAGSQCLYHFGHRTAIPALHAGEVFCLVHCNVFYGPRRSGRNSQFLANCLSLGFCLS